MTKQEIQSRLHERLTALGEHQGADCPSFETISEGLHGFEYKELLQWLKKAPAVDSPEYSALQEEHVARAANESLSPIVLPARHARQTVSYENREWTAAFGKVSQRLVEREDAMLALLGARGTGKTQMAVELIRHEARYRAEQTLNPEHLERWAWGHFNYQSHWAFAVYSNTMDFFLRLRRTFQPDPEEQEKGVLEAFIRPPLLILDEVHDRKGSEWENNLLTYLIDRRYQAGDKQTVLIANQTSGEFEQSIGSSIADRLQECGGIVECNWKSFRVGGWVSRNKPQTSPSQAPRSAVGLQGG